MWPSLVIAVGVVILSIGGFLAVRIHDPGVPVREDRLTPSHWRSGALMLWGWSIVGIGLVWLLGLVAWELVR